MLDLVSELEQIEQDFYSGRFNEDRVENAEKPEHGLTRIIKTGYEFVRDDWWDLTDETR